jgi:hypothetical protein
VRPRRTRSFSTSTLPSRIGSPSLLGGIRLLMSFIQPTTAIRKNWNWVVTGGSKPSRPLAAQSSRLPRPSFLRQAQGSGCLTWGKTGPWPRPIQGLLCAFRSPTPCASGDGPREPARQIKAGTEHDLSPGTKPSAAGTQAHLATVHAIRDGERDQMSKAAWRVARLLLLMLR